MSDRRKQETPSELMERLDRVTTADTPLTPAEQRFLTSYIKHGNATEAMKEAGYELAPSAYKSAASKLLAQPNIAAEVERVLAELKANTIATAQEVMGYFTSVMRGEIKDQFGLDAPLSERTRAAQELAKRTIDIENRQKGEPDQTLEIKLDWSRQ